MDRRTILAVAGAALAAPRMLLSQPAKRVYRIAILDEVGESVLQDMWSAFRSRLRELGYVEGSNVAFEVRHAGRRSGCLRSPRNWWRSSLTSSFLQGRPRLALR